MIWKTGFSKAMSYDQKSRKSQNNRESDIYLSALTMLNLTQYLTETGRASISRYFLDPKPSLE